MNLAIVGARQLGLDVCRAIIEAAIDRYDATAVVSGGAAGVDTWAELIAGERGLLTIVYLPQIHSWAGYQARNLQIARKCDALVRIAWAHSHTYGSGWTRDRARELGKPTEEFLLP